MDQAILNFSFKKINLINLKSIPPGYESKEGFFSVKTKHWTGKHFSIRRQRGSALRGREKLPPSPPTSPTLCAVQSTLARVKWIKFRLKLRFSNKIT